MRNSASNADHQLNGCEVRKGHGGRQKSNIRSLERSKKCSKKSTRRNSSKKLKAKRRGRTGYTNVAPGTIFVKLTRKYAHVLRRIAWQLLNEKSVEEQGVKKGLLEIQSMNWETKNEQTHHIIAAFRSFHVTFKGCTCRQGWMSQRTNVKWMKNNWMEKNWDDKSVQTEAWYPRNWRPTHTLSRRRG